MNDYIKREDAVARIADCCNGGIEVIKKEYSIDGFCEGLSEAIDAVNDAPAADVEPVRHGHWISDIGYAGWTCSECGDHEGNKTDKYCHNCGARMDGKEQEHDKV